MGQELDFDKLWQSAQPMMSFREPRHSIIMHATLSCGPGGAASARVRNISRRGMMAECRFRGAKGDRVGVYMRGLGEVTGSVVWARPNCIGVEFDEPVNPMAVLRKPVQKPKQSFVPHAVNRPWRPPLHASQHAA